jgi:hypothetical protein
MLKEIFYEKHWKFERITCCFRILLDILPFIHLFSDAAVVMLSGQLADGFATIFVGELVRPKKEHDCLLKHCYKAVTSYSHGLSSLRRSLLVFLCLLCIVPN